MRLKDYKLVFVAVGLIGVLLIATPALGVVLHLPGGEQFSELYLLGPDHMAENYPFNVAVGQNYTVYVGVTNHMGSSVYYTLYVKLRNETDLLPNSTAGTPSLVQPLYEYRFSIQDGRNWESPFAFSINTASTSANQTTINSMLIDNAVFDVNKPTALNSTNSMYFYQLVFELWMYNNQSNTMQFNNRFVDLQLNYTQVKQ